MRLFVGVEVDEATRGAIVQLIDRLRRRLRSADVKWVAAANLHLTLQFIGHVDEATTERVRHALTSPVDVGPFDIRVTGLGAFPPRGGPRVIWCGVEERSGRLLRVHGEVERRLASAAIIEPESRPYHPHVTIGRYRASGKASDRPVLARVHAGELGVCHVARITLYESRLSPHGPTYTAITHTPLIE